MITSPETTVGAVDDRVEPDRAEAGPGDVEALDQVTDLGQLTAGDLDPGELGSAGQSDSDLLALFRVGLSPPRGSRALRSVQRLHR